MNKSAFPHGAIMRGNYVIKDGQQGITKLEYFAAHAPDVPDWFAHKEWTTFEAVGTKIAEHVDHVESDMDRFIRWRIEYAKTMLQQLRELL